MVADPYNRPSYPRTREGVVHALAELRALGDFEFSDDHRVWARARVLQCFVAEVEAELRGAQPDRP